jgi:hypothetical protein
LFTKFYIAVFLNYRTGSWRSEKYENIYYTSPDSSEDASQYQVEVLEVGALEELSLALVFAEAYFESLV